MEVSLNIVNYKTKKHVIACLPTLAKAMEGSNLAWEVLVADNDSGEDISDLPNMFPKIPLKTFQHGENGGFGAGHNFLVSQSDAKVIVTLNPDTEFRQAGVVDTLYEMLMSDETIGAIGPRLVTGDGKTTQVWDHGEIKGIDSFMRRYFGNSHWVDRFQKEGQSVQPWVEVAWVSGAFLMMRKKDFDRLQGFDETIFLYKEEEDLQERLRKDLGKKIIYYFGKEVFHHSSVVATPSDHMLKSKAIFNQKHLPGWRAFIAKWLF